MVRKKSSVKLKTASLVKAKSLVQETNRPPWTSVTKVTEGSEIALFKTHFSGNFTEYIDSPESFEKRTKGKTADKQEQESINIDALHHPEKYAIAKEELIDTVPDARNSGNYLQSHITIWYVKDHAKFDLPEVEYGIFYDRNCYIILYSIKTRGGDTKHVTYYWQGRKSKTEDKGTSALLSAELSRTIGRSTLVRVVENKEPDHFLAHFLGYLVVRKGSRETWDPSRVNLYVVRGTNEVNTTTIQVKFGAFSLNSNDCFILDTHNTIFIWEGEGANEHERKTAESTAHKALEHQNSKEFITIKEEKEPDSFWSALGGKGSYASPPHLKKGDIKARLFQCSDKTGVFKVFEIYNFTQDDLDNDDVMLLDTFESVFVWIGNNSTQKEKEMAKTVAQDYIKLADDGRSLDSAIYIVEPGAEPLQFTVFFKGWDEEVAKNGEDLYSRKLKTLNLESSVVGGMNNSNLPQKLSNDIQVTFSPNDTNVPNTNGIVYPYSVLKQKPRPKDVVEVYVEAFLSDDDFKKYFRMDKTEFYKMPNWKRLRTKQSSGLY